MIQNIIIPNEATSSSSDDFWGQVTKKHNFSSLFDQIGAR